MAKKANKSVAKVATVEVVAQITTQATDVVEEQQEVTVASEQQDAQEQDTNFVVAQDVVKATIFDPIAQMQSNEEKLAELQKTEPTVKMTVPTVRRQLIEQNGMQKPGVGTIGCRIWDEIDTLARTLQRAPAIAEIRAMPSLAMDLPVNLSSIYARWRKFNGVEGRVAKVATPIHVPVKVDFTDLQSAGL